MGNVAGCVRILIKPTNVGHRGQLYRVTYEGEMLVEGSRNPEYDAARALLAIGVTGQAETWRHGAAVPSMRINIELAEQRTIEESATVGLKLRRWTPPDEAISRVRPRSARAIEDAAEDEPSFTQMPANDACLPQRTDAA
jgi:hypothetical protein